MKLIYNEEGRSLVSIVRLIIGLACSILGVFLLIKIMRKHKKIDTESVAVVKEVIDLGRDGVSKEYAIKYDIQSSQPFELIVTPCKKMLPVGAERSIFYEKADPTKNYYFKTLGQSDNRFVMPIVMLSIGLLTFISTIVMAIIP
jgi:hypothetical protein